MRPGEGWTCVSDELQRQAAGLAGAVTRLQFRRPLLPAIEALLAATALQHDLTLVMRNTRNFACLGCGLVKRWEGEAVQCVKYKRTLECEC